MEDHWIDGERYKPQDLSIFGHAIRTNYDIEAGATTYMNCVLCEENLQFTKGKIRKYQEIIFDIWDVYC